ncbi:alpha/beta hydrolase [Streptomyces sp. NPDC001586]|uniref:alpha/beta fold hydrolase n=1 Tax=unclassified Streptomyces TaxID=2593676 RepID=UPI00332151BE
MERRDVSIRTIRSGPLVFEVDARTCAEPRIPPVLFVRARAEGEATIHPQNEALLPLADLVGVRIAGLSGPGTLPPDSTIGDLADGLAVVLDELGLARVNVCGTSHGGEIAYRFAQRHPGRTERVVLTGASGHPPVLVDGTTPAGLVARAKGATRQELVDEVVSRLLCLDPELPVRGRETLRWILTDLFRSSDDTHIDVWARCLQLVCNAPQPTGLSVPLLAVTGEHDVAVRPADCRALAAMSSDAVFATIREADHWVFLTRARDHLDLTRRFLLGEALDDAPYLAALEHFPRPRTALSG